MAPFDFSSVHDTRILYSIFTKCRVQPMSGRTDVSLELEVGGALTAALKLEHPAPHPDTLDFEPDPVLSP